MTTYEDLGSEYQYPSATYQPKWCYIPEEDEIMEYHTMERVYDIDNYTRNESYNEYVFIGFGYDIYTYENDILISKDIGTKDLEIFK